MRTIDPTPSPNTSGHAGFRFSLRALLLVVTIACILFATVGTWIFHLHDSQKAIEDVRRLVHEHGGGFSIGNVNGDYFIDLPDKNLSDDDVKKLAREMRRLRPIALDHEGRIQLDLSGNPITKDAIGYLKGLRIQRVNLSRTALGNDAAAAVAELHVEWLIEVETTAITADGVDKLRQALPFTRVIHTRDDYDTEEKRLLDNYKRRYSP